MVGRLPRVLVILRVLPGLWHLGPTLCVILLFVLGVVHGQEQPAQTGRLYFDRHHGEFPAPAPLAGIAKKLNLELMSVEDPISAAALKSSRLLYLRAPSKTFAPEEKDAI